ncbi:MAG: hypothetical protein U0984_15315 [Prosthecobacter sp.]|nr:hypothetical protein [Prosthecobacter sp.]
MTAASALWLATGAALGQEPDFKPWERAALSAVKAINSGNADLFLAWTHPEEQYRLKAMFMRRLLTQTQTQGEGTLEAQLRPYGVRNLEELARMPEAAFIAISIPSQYAANDAVMREAMSQTTVKITKTVKVEEDHYEVHLALHVPLAEKPLDKVLVANVVREGDAWKYNGFR